MSTHGLVLASVFQYEDNQSVVVISWKIVCAQNNFERTVSNKLLIIIQFLAAKLIHDKRLSPIVVYALISAKRNIDVLIALSNNLIVCVPGACVNL